MGEGGRDFGFDIICPPPSPQQKQCSAVVLSYENHRISHHSYHSNFGCIIKMSEKVLSPGVPQRFYGEPELLKLDVLSFLL